MRPLLPLRAALENPHLLGPVMGGASREPMRALLLASQGEELTESELLHYRRLTGRDDPPEERAKEVHIFAGRRSGKSSGCAGLAVYAAAMCDYSDRLSPGERGVVLLIAENQKQAKVLLNYIAGIFDLSPALSKLIINRTQTSLPVGLRSSTCGREKGQPSFCASRPLGFGILPRPAAVVGDSGQPSAKASAAWLRHATRAASADLMTGEDGYRWWRRPTRCTVRFYCLAVWPAAFPKHRRPSV